MQDFTGRDPRERETGAAVVFLPLHMEPSGLWGRCRSPEHPEPGSEQVLDIYEMEEGVPSGRERKHEGLQDASGKSDPPSRAAPEGTSSRRGVHALLLPEGGAGPPGASPRSGGRTCRPPAACARVSGAPAAARCPLTGHLPRSPRGSGASRHTWRVGSARLLRTDTGGQEGGRDVGDNGARWGLRSERRRPGVRSAEFLTRVCRGHEAQHCPPPGFSPREPASPEM